MPSSLPSSASPKASPDLSAIPSPASIAHTSSSESSSTVKISSPLNPATPPMRSKPLAYSDLQANQNSPNRSRVHSFSTIRSPSPPPSENAARVGHPVPALPSKLEKSGAIFRSRSSSPAGRGRSPARSDQLHVIASGSETPTHTQSQSWWSSREALARPWKDPPKKQNTIPPEQSERWERVANAAVSVLGTAGDVAHEVLLLSADYLSLVPIPGLETAAKTLLNIWDTLQQVDMNRLACLRLTERCADILISIREEIHQAGDEVAEELHEPIVNLVQAYSRVYKLLQKQINRPFLKRYLKRDEILGKIQGCDAELNNALGMFSLSIQIRILRQVQESERQRHADTETLIHALLDSRGIPAPQPGQLMLSDHEKKQLPKPELSPPTSPTMLKPDQVVNLLQLLRDRQNEQDNFHDMADLRRLMRTALQTRNDAEMIEVLQVGRHEMPEAIKTLQRALEREVEREQDGDGQLVTEDIPVFTEESIAIPGPSLTRSGTVGSTSTTSQWSKRTQASASDSSAKARGSRDTLDREFLESGIDALRRMSRGTELSLPPWTITRYEVDRDEKIGVGFFSDVYKGTWRDRSVAIKVLAPTTPRKLFVHEIQIWKSLDHLNVLELLGASSAVGEPPWFFVSPYLKNGSLVTYLKGLSSLDEVNLLRMIYQVAKGMHYLHDQGVLHGDLKAANVLVDDDLRCVISDFGQSEMKTEVWRITGTSPLHGTLRWQAPELMTGQSKPTTEIDVYAFAISCVEIMTKGNLPWPHMDDDSVRYFVLKEGQRPEIPNSRLWSKKFAALIATCWHQAPASRPPFSKIVASIKKIGAEFGCLLEDSVTFVEPKPVPAHKKSPSMQPKPLPIIPPPELQEAESSTDGSYTTASPGHHIISGVSPDHPLRRADSIYTHPDGSLSSIIASTPDTQSEFIHIYDRPGYESPVPLDEVLAEIRNERRYRLLLQHEFHPSLTLPLWSPTPVAIGAVGYLSKPEGIFITLFNSFNPNDTSKGLIKGMASLYGYGLVSQGNQRQDKRNPAQRGLDAIQGWISSKRDSANVSRRYSFATRSGHKTAFLCTETTMYRYIEDLSTPKKWFIANVDEIMRIYGEAHQISKEDLFLVIGTLNAPDYALFVSHNHPDGQVHFNVFGGPRAGQPWGEFSMDTDISASMLGGPNYHEEPVNKSLSADKVSKVNTSSKWDTILLSRLRFKPDIREPTSL